MRQGLGGKGDFWRRDTKRVKDLAVLILVGLFAILIKIV